MTATRGSGNRFGPVQPANVPNRRARRADPDDLDTPAPPAPAAEPNPAPEPAAPVVPEQPTPQAATLPPPAAPPPPGALARPPAGDDLLATVLGNPAPGGTAAPSSVDMLLGLARLRNNPDDPMQDWGPNGTRMLTWLAAALSQYADMTGTTRQDVLRDLMLGNRQIPYDIIDANFRAKYGYPLADYRPPR